MNLPRPGGQADGGAVLPPATFAAGAGAVDEKPIRR
jgi:hypothetical protein